MDKRCRRYLASLRHILYRQCWSVSDARGFSASRARKYRYVVRLLRQKTADPIALTAGATVRKGLTLRTQDVHRLGGR